MRVVHFEIPVTDPARASKFYTDTLGWQIHKWDGPSDYWLISTGTDGPGINGAFMKREGATVNTVAVPSVDDIVASVEANGGKLAVPKMPIPGVGYLAFCQDTEGNLFGVTQADPAAQ